MTATIRAASSISITASNQCLMFGLSLTREDIAPFGFMISRVLRMRSEATHGSRWWATHPATRGGESVQEINCDGRRWCSWGRAAQDCPNVYIWLERVCVVKIDFRSLCRHFCQQLGCPNSRDGTPSRQPVRRGARRCVARMLRQGFGVFCGGYRRVRWC